jgi:branched-chain amino acid transport system ATP-binding protein
MMAALLEAKNLHKQFGAVTAAGDITVAIERGSVTGLIGSNGAGKTTFVNMITGYLKPDSGTIEFAGRDITALTPRVITRLGIARSFQIPQLYDSLSVHENLLAAIGVAGRNGQLKPGAQAPHSASSGQAPSSSSRFGKEQEQQVAGQLLEQFRLEDYREREARVLPQGVRKALDIALSMVARPQVLLLDEPTSGVSADEKFSIMDMIMGALSAQGVTTLFVEHDMEVVARYAQRVLAFYDGRIIADGMPQQVLQDVDVRRYVVGMSHSGPRDHA